MDKWYEQNETRNAGIYTDSSAQESRNQYEDTQRSPIVKALIVVFSIIALLFFFSFVLPGLILAYNLTGSGLNSRPAPNVDTHSDNPGSGMGQPLDNLVSSGEIPEPHIDNTTKVLEISNLNTADSLHTALDAVNETKSPVWTNGFVSGDVAGNDWVFPHTMRASSAEGFLAAQPAFDTIQLQPKDPDPFVVFTVTCAVYTILENCMEDAVSRTSVLITELPHRNAMWRDVSLTVTHPDVGDATFKITDQRGPSSTAEAMR